MNPPDERGILLSDEIQMSAPNFGKKKFSPHIILKTKGLKESLQSAEDDP